MTQIDRLREIHGQIYEKRRKQCKQCRLKSPMIHSATPTIPSIAEIIHTENLIHVKHYILNWIIIFGGGDRTSVRTYMRSCIILCFA